MIDLRGISLKVTRAERHRKKLGDLINTFLKSSAYTLFVDREKENGYYIVRVRVLSLPPDEISPIIGDIVHNLRSALDHLACQFVLDTGAKPTFDTAFPIFADRPDIPGKRLRKWKRITEGMSYDAIAFLHDCQPYKVRHRPDPHRLSLLSTLSNWDKHHDILVAGHYFGGFEISGVGLAELIEQPTRVSIEDGSEICRFRTNGEKDGKVEMGLRAQFSLCFDSPAKPILHEKLILDLLESIHTYVSMDVLRTVTNTFNVK